MATNDNDKFANEYEAFIAGMKAANQAASKKHPKPPFPPHRPPIDWYDGYNHMLPPPRPLPPFPPFPPVPPGPIPPGPKPPCINCRPKTLDKYGFVPVVGGKYYTGSGKACCPVKVTITKILANEIIYKDAAGTEHSKTFHDFMTSSWRDKSL